MEVVLRLYGKESSEMKTIKVKYVGFWEGWESEKIFLTRLLEKHYNVEISDEPDYVICSCFGFYDYLDYPQVRIMYSGENYIPDFNYVDYAISVYPVNFLDRHQTIPGIFMSPYESILALENKNRHYESSVLDTKPYFANLIAGHESEGNMRGNLLKLFEGYKRVESAGSFQNNMPEGWKVSRLDGTKLEFQKKCKFTICSESIAHEGFVTEKIYEAFLADTIPIYYGSSTVSQIFNRKAYIDVRDYESLEDVLARVIELDSDDEQYLEMLNQPIFVQEQYITDSIAKLEAFLCHIFDQPLEKAYRRCRMFSPANHEKRIIKWKRRELNCWHKMHNAAKKKYDPILYVLKDLVK